MARAESSEYTAKLLEDNGVVRGRIPAPLIRNLGGRPGDYLVFRTDGGGRVQISLQKLRKNASKSTRGGRANARAAGKR
jgi:hypothetical protein